MTALTSIGCSGGRGREEGVVKTAAGEGEPFSGTLPATRPVSISDLGDEGIVERRAPGSRRSGPDEQDLRPDLVR